LHSTTHELPFFKKKRLADAAVSNCQKKEKLVWVGHTLLQKTYNADQNCDHRFRAKFQTASTFETLHFISTEVSCSIFYQLNIIGIKDHLRLRSSRLRKQPLERGFVWDPFFCLVDLQQHPNLLLFLSVPHLLR
jgi:hypothetical protein